MSNSSQQETGGQNITQQHGGTEQHQPVYLLNQGLQCSLIILIILTAIITNGLIVHNIAKCQVCYQF